MPLCRRSDTFTLSYLRRGDAHQHRAGGEAVLADDGVRAYLAAVGYHDRAEELRAGADADVLADGGRAAVVRTYVHRAIDGAPPCGRAC